MREFVSDQRIADYISAKTGIRPGGSAFTTLGVILNGQIIGGVLFNHYTGFDIHMTVAGEAKAFTPIFYERVRAYVFGELGCTRISITTQQQSVVDLAKRLGAQTEGFKRDQYGPGKGGVMLGLLKSDWLMTRRLRPNSTQVNVKEI